jgi:Cytochrome c554 and c-prime
MGKPPHPRARAGTRAGSRALLAAAVTIGALLVLAAPALGIANAHPYTYPTATAAQTAAGDVKQCFTCHAAQFNEWANSSPYALGALRGHNVTMAQTLLDPAHNGEEGFAENCTTCHSPYAFNNLDGTASTLGEFVTPLNQVGPWSLVEPYKTAVKSSQPIAGFYFPSDHPSPTTKAGWEGISCRVCHDVNTPQTSGPFAGLPSLRFFDATTYTYVDVASATDLCQQCHQPGPASDDSRTAPAESVHSGIACTSCHMTDASGAIIHTLNAGQKGDALNQTACGQAGCHKTPMPAGHPDVTKLTTSFTNMAKYQADPVNLVGSANARLNIHFITCDACHAPTVTGTFTMPGAAGTIAGTATSSIRTAQFFPKGFDGANPVVWSLPLGADPSTLTNWTLVATGTAPAFPFSISNVAAGTTLYFTQAVNGPTFPGLGRGVAKVVKQASIVTIKTSKARVHPRTKVTISGVVTPNVAGKKVVVQISRNKKTWKTFKTLTVLAASNYTVKWTAPTVKGKYFFRTKFAGTPAIAAGTSKVKLVTVF